MSVRDNWERLIRATLVREEQKNAGKSQGKSSNGIAGVVPTSLVQSTNIDLILEAADEIQDEDPNVARIMCEQAYTLAQNLDPSSNGRGVLQFKTGLMSVIKQKLARKDGAPMDRTRDIEHLRKFYQLYKEQHGVDDIEREERRLLETGKFVSSNITEMEQKSLQMKTVYSTLRALIEVMECLSKDADTKGLEQQINNELRRIKRVSAPYNIVPTDGPSLTNPMGVFPEVKGALFALKYNDQYPRLPTEIGEGSLDMFDLLEYVFGFQKDNIRNQRENVILLLANAQCRHGLPNDSDPKIDERAIDQVFFKVLDNYIKWCRYLRIGAMWNSTETITKDKKLFFIALYFCIWGEAANIRHLPECLCYIFHHMAKELNTILDHRVAAHADSCITNGGVSFLEKIICPIYDTLKAETNIIKSGKASHASWRNYDDFNEYFWSKACFDLGWPMNMDSEFLTKPKGHKKTGKTAFVEHRTFFHLYRSFHRLWILLALMFQVLTIIAFHDGRRININTFKVILSIGPSYAAMNLFKSFLDVLLMFGAYSTAQCMAISRLFIRFFWWGFGATAVTYLYIKLLDEKNQPHSNSTYFRIYLIVVGVYIVLLLTMGLLLKLPACHSLSEVSDNSFLKFFKWIYQERYFVGRGLFERITDDFRYVLYWVVILGSKFTFAYFLQIKPLVSPTRIIIKLKDVNYSWHDLVSKHNKNALTIASLWAPVATVYLLDIYIWYTILSAIVGGVMGARARLGEIRSLDMIHKRFETFPEAFVKSLVSPHARRLAYNRQAPQVQEDEEVRKENAVMFGPCWNEIITSLREEDLISNREMDLLLMPSNTGSLRLIQWPLFLLSGKIPLAIDLAVDCKDSQVDLWNIICNDEYMEHAVRETYCIVERILHSLVDGEGRSWVEKIFFYINNSIKDGSLLITINLKNIKFVLSRFTALIGLLNSDTPEGTKGAAKALFDFYVAVTHEFLSHDLRDQFETWQILTKARDEGRLFNKINWPKDREIKEQLKRLELLLKVRDSAANVPKNLEARRRLQFFTNSLFMDMPSTKPVYAATPFCVLTPYYKETVLYSAHELRKENEDGISTLFYLQKIYPDEWKNFLERLGKSADKIDRDENSVDSLELRFWASYRGQTLARTVRGMMYYRRALMLQSYFEKRTVGVDDNSLSKGFESSPESRAQADLKFTYVISCQLYGKQKQDKAPEAADISLLLRRNEALRVSYIDEVATGDANVTKEYFSKLVKADSNGKDEEIYAVKLPGNPILGEGKPENQNHAIIFTRGEAIQTIDMNQDNYLEEAMKMRNLLEEFRADHGIRPPTILGVREHVFTGSVSSLAWFMSNQETSFVTLGQRVLAYPLKIRLHYGHPDVFDRIFHITRGGVSKASKVINISEDIYAGFNTTLRQGNVTHHEYIQVGKGRDVGLNQIATFEGKVAGGNGEQVLSRDVYRLGQLLDFFRMLSFYFTTVGYYFCTMMTVLTVYIFLYGRVYLALSGVDRTIEKAALLSGNTALDAVLNAQFLIQIGIFTAIPMVVGLVLETGWVQAIVSFATMQLQLCSVFFTFSMGTRTHYFGRTILHGGAKYRETGRGFVVQHIKFAQNYRVFSRSHFVKALEVALLLIVYIAYGYTSAGGSSMILLTVSSWFLVVSWLFAPYIFNPSGFEWQKTVEDFDDWTSWLFYKGGAGIKAENSWESWWIEEQAHIKTLRGRILETLLSLRFFIFQYGIVYKLHLTGKHTSLSMYGLSWVILVVFALVLKILAYKPRKFAGYMMAMRFVQGGTAIATVTAISVLVAVTALTVADLFASALALVATGWGITCIAVTWKRVVRRIGLWESVIEFARIYDAAMGAIIFVPVAVLSWFPFVSTFQSRILFNQAFSRGLEISLILEGNQANKSPKDNQDNKDA